MSGMIDLADIPLFLAVARHGSFIEASRRTKTPPSTMSRAIARLEEALSVQLFHRTSRRVSLTHAGTRLLDRAGALTEELQTILDDVSARNEQAAGLVRITAPVMSGAGHIARSVMAFAAKHPRITLDLQLSNSIVDLAEAGFDVGFRAGPVTDASLVARRLWELPFTLAASRDLVRRELRGSRVLTRERLSSLPAITTTGAAWRFRTADGSIEEVPLLERVRVNDPRVAVDAAVRGLGIVRAPVDAVKQRGLVPLSCALGELEPRSMFAVFPSRRLLPKRVRLLIDWVAADATKPMA